VAIHTLAVANGSPPEQEIRLRRAAVAVIDP